MTKPLRASDDTGEDTELDTRINNGLSNNITDVSSDELNHSDDECLKYDSIHIPTLSDTPIDATAQLKDDATCATPTKRITKKIKINLCLKKK